MAKGPACRERGAADDPAVAAIAFWSTHTSFAGIADKNYNLRSSLVIFIREGWVSGL